MGGLRVTTWNVNGIRNPFGYQPWRDNRTFNGMFDILEADIVIMQELKIQRKDLRDDMVLVPGWDCFFSLPKHKKGYSGVGIYTRQSVCAPIRAEEGLLGVLNHPELQTPYRELPEDQCIGGYPTPAQVAELGVDPAALDAEGRCVVLEFPAFVLFGVYSPANSNGLRDDFRYGFICALDTRIRNLAAMGKRVILTGDLNVSRAEIDTARAEENMRKEGITHEEYISTPNRRIFNQLIEGGEVFERDDGRERPVLWDICREFHPTRTGMYTHWEQKINARPGNFGSRIDYVLCSIEMKSWFSEGNIQEGLMGSDHCPVYASLKEKVALGEQEVHILDIMNPPGMFKEGKRLRKHSAKDVPAFSGRRLPEFDKRRSIKDMFSRKPSLPKGESTVGSLSWGPAEALPVEPASHHTPSEEGTLIASSAVSSSTNQSTPVSLLTFSAANQPKPSPELKRRPSESTASGSPKRSKTNAVVSKGAASDKGQQSLKGFFKPRGPSASSSGSIKSVTERSVGGMSTEKPASLVSLAIGVTPSAEHSPAPVTNADISLSSSKEKGTDHDGSPVRPSSDSGSLRPSPQSTTPAEQTIIDPIVSKESWDKLFTKRAPPRCEGHNEPCVSLTTKKPGINCGRAFWICPRPVGASGNKEKGTQWRCHTFIWASDWNGQTASSASAGDRSGLSSGQRPGGQPPG